MTYLIDTTWIIDHLNDDTYAVQFLQDFSAHGIAASIITYLEAFQGTIRLQRPVSQKKFDELFGSLPVLPLTPAIAKRCARLREHLKRQGKQTNRGTFDLVFAATAIEHGFTLATRNRQDFVEIPGLMLFRQ